MITILRKRSTFMFLTDLRSKVFVTIANSFKDSSTADLKYIKYKIDDFDALGYVLSLENLGYQEKGYVIAIYAEILNRARLFVLNNIYENQEEGKKAIRHYINYFPLYGYSCNYNL